MDLKFKLMGLFFDKIIQLNPKSAMAWNNKGTALGSLGMHEKALQAFDKALQLNPNDALVWNNKGAADSTGNYWLPIYHVLEGSVN